VRIAACSGRFGPGSTPVFPKNKNFTQSSQSRKGLQRQFEPAFFAFLRALRKICIHFGFRSLQVVESWVWKSFNASSLWQATRIRTL
jgi:hypothetical protein